MKIEIEITAEQILDLFFPWSEPDQGMGSYEVRYRVPNEAGRKLTELLSGERIMQFKNTAGEWS